MQYTEAVTGQEKATLPTWHKDAKWIVGILLLGILSATLLSAAITRVTARESAIQIASTIMATAFSPQGLDDEDGIEEFRREIEAAGEARPFPDRDLTITAEEVEGFSAREIRILIFRKIAEPLYDNLDAAIAALPPQQREQAANDLFIFSLLSPATHAAAQRLSWSLAAISVIFMVALLYFSHRWGKLVSPAVVLLLSSTTGACLLLLLRIAQANDSQQPPPGSGVSGLLGGTLQVLAPIIAEALLLPYFVPFALGLSLLCIAGIGKLVQSRR